MGTAFLLEKPLKSLINSFPVLARINAPDGSILFVNQSWCEYTGMSLDDAKGSDGLQIVHSDDLSNYAAEWQSALSKGTIFQFEARIRRANGEYRWFQIVESPFLDESGSLVQWHATYIDIQDRKSVENTLRRTEKLLDDVQKLTHAGSWAWNVIPPKNLYWSSETYRIFGFDPEKDPCSCERAMERIHPDDVPKTLEILEQSIRDKSCVEMNYRVLLPNEPEKHVHCIGHPVLNGAGDLVEYVGTVINLTEQHRQIATLEEAFRKVTRLKDHLQNENAELRQEADQISLFEDIVGATKPFRAVLEQVVKAAPTDCTVLLVGETGVGKRRVARAIHKRSHHSGGPFIHVNCAALSHSAMTELFGFEKGDATGTQPHIGHFKLAEGGTIYLDEIGELPAPAQSAILRIIKDQESDEDNPGSVKVRILAATSRNLQGAVDEGTFRQDLFYRLNVIPIHIPALRERREDIPLLVKYLADFYARRTGKEISGIDDRAISVLQSYNWPGNVRELQNMIERAVILCDSRILSIDESWLRPEPSRSPAPIVPSTGTLEEREIEAIKSALAASRGRVSGPHGAAVKLGIPRSTLESKIRSFGIKKYQFKAE